MVTRADVEAAATRLRDRVRATPTSAVELSERRVWLKLEHLQRGGAFKLRGATNALLSLDPLPAAVVAASGGNHGIGVAHAAMALDVDATIVVPTTVPLEKARRLSDLNATVVRHGTLYVEAEEHARHLAADLGAPFIHAFADPAVISGQGTIALEIPRACDAVVVPVGGGGLIAGVAAALADEPVTVIGVEPVGIPTLHAALARGEPVDVAIDSITASALGATRTDPLNLGIVQRAVDRIELVDDAAILVARDVLWSECRLAVEPAAATTVAALLEGLLDDVARPCLVLSGANSVWIPRD